MTQKDQDYAALFNAPVELNDTPAKNAGEYTPSAEKGTNGIYQSIIRFIPWWQNPKNSIQEKWVSWLVDPVTNKGKFVDCPSSIGKPSPLQDTYWKLKKSESVQDQKKADIFSRRHSYSCLIQVIKDDHNKELEGKILNFRFGVKVWEKIQSELKPPIGEPHNPFDLLKGKLFALKITKVSGFNNYDQSKFVDKVIPLVIPNEQGKLVPITEKSDKATVFTFLKEHSSDLTKHAYKEWDQDTHDYVNQVIVAVTGYGNTASNYASISNKNVGSNPTGTGKPATPKSGITSQDITLDDLNTDLNLTNLPDDLDLPDLSSSNGGIGGDLADALAGL